MSTITSGTQVSIPSLDEAKQAIISVLSAEPGCARTMNADAIADEFFFGPDAIVQDEDAPPNEAYDAFDQAVEALVAEGLLETQEVFGLVACHLSQEGWDRYGG